MRDQTQTKRRAGESAPAGPNHPREQKPRNRPVKVGSVPVVADPDSR